MSVHTRRSTRASGRATLSGSIEDVIRDAKTVAMQEKRAHREQKYQSSHSSAFHSFMKLPTILRDRIYLFAMEDPDSPRHLPSLRAPTLALVSKQVQIEAVRVFLTQCTFYLDIISNYKDIAELDEKASRGTLLSLYPKYAGRTCCVEGSALDSGCCEGLSKRTRLWLSKMQGSNEVLFFPNLKLHITPARCCGRHRRNNGNDRTAVFSLRARGGRLLLDFKSTEKTDSRASLDKFRRNAEKVAYAIAARHQGHRGFSYEEVDEIAKSFRYWPPGAPERE
ncbi:hypothetical protein F5Y10DRAFT_103434 [Nemania abortiva]|nr:hypothetical protein F5Y10DRAFT_103434 [Nemania abortiva]